MTPHCKKTPTGGTARSLRLAALGILVTLVTLVAPRSAQASPYRRAGWATSGMVVSESALASQAGVEVLKRGGNAVDAAAATGFVLAVTFPWAGNLGGGGFAVFHLADTGEGGRDLTLDFRETAPSRASRDMYLDPQGEVVPDLSLFSPLAVGVPGTVDGLLRLWRDHGSGTISRAALLEPAIRFARDGFEISDDLANRLNLKKDHLSRDPAARSLFVRGDGRDWRPGDRLVQPDLAASLIRIAAQGRDGFYTGANADRIAEAMERGGGILSREDLAGYASRYRDPVRGRFRGYEIVTMGPPSSGGVLIVQLLNMLEPRSLVELGWNSADYIHLLTEAERLAFADRAEHLGDPDFYPVSLDTLLSKGYAGRRARSISMERATPSAEVSAGKIDSAVGGETTHFCVIDARGNAVSITTTLNTGFGSGIVAPGTGVLLNNEMDDFSAKPGVPNVYGLIGDEANAIAPGKRMLSSMSPTIVLCDGSPVLVLGSPGGSMIITSVLQVLLNVLVFEMPVAEAVAVPRVHAQWLPDALFFEAFGLSKETRAELERREHALEVFPDPIGRVNAIQVLADGFHAGPDIRGGCTAAGY